MRVTEGHLAMHRRFGSEVGVFLWSLNRSCAAWLTVKLQQPECKEEKIMKRRLALLTLLFVCIASLVLMPTLAQQNDLNPAGPKGDSDKFLRMGRNAIPFNYIVVLDSDTDVVNGNAAFAWQ